MLEKEFNYYLEHQLDLLKDYEDKIIVIKDNQVIGSYDTEIEALVFTKKEHQVGSFLIQKCSRGSVDYTETYHSNVSY